MKNRIQHFNNLPADMRNKAIANYEANQKEKNLPVDYTDRQYHSLEYCLHCSFTFRDTPEGHSTWENICITYSK